MPYENNESRAVWKEYWRENIPKNFVIHHIDENPINNDITNLTAIHKKKHGKLHGIRNLRESSKYFKAYGMTRPQLALTLGVSELTIQDLANKPERVIGALKKLRTWKNNG